MRFARLLGQKECFLVGCQSERMVAPALIDLAEYDERCGQMIEEPEPTIEIEFAEAFVEKTRPCTPIAVVIKPVEDFVTEKSPPMASVTVPVPAWLTVARLPVNWLVKSNVPAVERLL